MDAWDRRTHRAGSGRRGARFEPPPLEKIDMGKITEEQKADLADMLLDRHRMVYLRLSQV